MVVYVIWSVLLLVHVSHGALFNAAHRISATQSSTAHGGLATRAIDGITNGVWGGGSCTHTAQAGLEWLEVDLGEVHQIDHISVWGRTDGYSERLLGAKLKIGSNICGTLKNMGKAGGPDNITCSEEMMRGQRVRIEQIGQYLTVCEIQVWVNDTNANGAKDEPATIGYIGEQGSEYTNVAYQKETTQSSVGWGGVSSRAVDGFVKLSWNSGSCTHTTASTLEYWEVDLGRSYEIDHVLVYPRNDAYTERIQGAKLLVGGAECGTLTDKGKNPEGLPDKITCYTKNLSKGRKVRIELFKNYLTLCEVQVMVRNDKLDEEPATMEPIGQYIVAGDEMLVNIAVGKNATQSSDWGNGRYTAKEAVDGVTNQNFGLSCCTHTRHENAWWKLDLGRVYNISEIRVYGRTDASTERIQWGKVFIGSNMCGLMTDNKKKAGYYDSIKCPGHNVGRHLTVKILGPYLTLCELQVLVTPENAKDDPEELSTAPAHGLERVYNNITYFNVAHNKPAIQSTTGWDGIASRAVDGYPHTQHYNSKSCTHTLNTGPQHWQVDLGRVYDIDYILVYGRTDAYTDRINGARVYIGHHQCGTLTDKKTLPNNITCAVPAYNKGRIVKIDLLKNYLTLCEVQVMVRADKLQEMEEHSTAMPQYSNVAISKPTTQSSTAHGGASSRAVDGWPDKLHWSWGSCTHTNYGELEWWQVDLEAEYAIDNIQINGRGDCCQDRMRNAIVLLDGKTIAGLSYYDKQTHWKVNVGNRRGQVVKISQLAILTLCEVQVMVDNYYEETEETEETSLALKGQATSSSVRYGGTAELAVDGNTEANFYRGSCMMTGVSQGTAWLKVTVNEGTKVGVVHVYPRLDSYQKNTIDGAVVRAGDHYCGILSYSTAIYMYAVDCGGVDAVTVTVSKLGVLSVCEIVVHESQ